MSNNTLLVLLPIIPILGVVWYFALSGPSSTVDYKENTVAAVDKPVANNDELEEYGGECAVGEEQGVGRIGILNEDIQESLFDLLDLEHEEDKPFDDLQMALCLATDPFPDLKACSDEANSNHGLHFPPHKL